MLVVGAAVWQPLHCSWQFPVSALCVCFWRLWFKKPVCTNVMRESARHSLPSPSFLPLLPPSLSLFLSASLSPTPSPLTHSSLPPPSSSPPLLLHQLGQWQPLRRRLFLSRPPGGEHIHKFRRNWQGLRTCTHANVHRCMHAQARRCLLHTLTC